MQHIWPQSVGCELIRLCGCSLEIYVTFLPPKFCLSHSSLTTRAVTTKEDVTVATLPVAWSEFDFLCPSYAWARSTAGEEGTQSDKVAVVRLGLGIRWAKRAPALHSLPEELWFSFICLQEAQTGSENTENVRSFKTTIASGTWSQQGPNMGSLVVQCETRWVYCCRW